MTLRWITEPSDVIDASDSNGSIRIAYSVMVDICQYYIRDIFHLAAMALLREVTYQLTFPQVKACGSGPSHCYVEPMVTSDQL